MNRKALSIALLAAACALAPAAETAVDDLRLQISLTPRDQETDFSGTSSGGTDFSGSDDDAWDERYRVGVAWVRSLEAIHPGTAGGFIYGAGLAWDRGSVEDDGNTTTADTLMLDGRAGWAFAVNEAVHLELTGVLGIGYASVDGEEFGDDQAVAYEYGATAGGFYTFANGWQIGAEAGWLATVVNGVSLSDADLDADTVKDTIEFDTTFSGLTVGLSLGKRF